MFNKEVWVLGELLAQKYLIKQGYKIFETNKKLANAEVDIVALCPKKVLIKELKAEYKSGQIIKSSYLAEKKNICDTIVFVEVKARSSLKYGLPQEAVKTKKQMHIKRFAETFMANSKYYGMPMRYDIVSVLDNQITEHIKNAF